MCNVTFINVISKVIISYDFISIVVVSFIQSVFDEEKSFIKFTHRRRETEQIQLSW